MPAICCGRLTLAQHHLRRAGTQRAVVVDAGVSEVLVGQVPQPGKGLVGGQLPRPLTCFQQAPEVARRTCLPSSDMG